MYGTSSQRRRGRLGSRLIAGLSVWLISAALAQAQEPGRRTAPGPVVLRLTLVADGKPVPRVLLRLGSRYAVRSRTASSRSTAFRPARIGW